jgi:gamma-glutamylcyclotransferase
MLYFAYGSNLHAARLRQRVGAVRIERIGRLDGHRLAFNKRGRDGSGKANLVREATASVWGVVYEIAAESWTELDRFEGGYERVSVEIEPAAGGALAAHTYASTRLCGEPPFDWYKELVVRGARAHGLPAEWIQWLEATEARPGPES